MNKILDTIINRTYESKYESEYEFNGDLDLITSARIDTIIEEVDFCKQAGIMTDPCWVIPLNTLYSILENHIPEFKAYFDAKRKYTSNH